jgi:hypothetical protein
VAGSARSAVRSSGTAVVVCCRLGSSARPGPAAAGTSCARSSASRIRIYSAKRPRIQSLAHEPTHAPLETIEHTAALIDRLAKRIEDAILPAPPTASADNAKVETMAA